MQLDGWLAVVDAAVASRVVHGGARVVGLDPGDGEESVAGGAFGALAGVASHGVLANGAGCYVAPGEDLGAVVTLLLR